MNDQAPRADASPLACNLSEPDLARRRDAISRDLFQHAEEIRELKDGFAYRYPAVEPWAGKLLDFIAVERRCCPFFTFELAFEPNDGPLWLRLRGLAEIKAYIRDGLTGNSEPVSLA